jgi:hypothetical protein
MDENQNLQSVEIPESKCANCGRPLDPSDRFCRDCGLPTVYQARTQRLAAAPPDMGELKRAFDLEPDPKPFTRPDAEDESEAAVKEELTTGNVVRATNPTQAFRMASSTLVMIAAIVVLALVGFGFLILAFRP